jgi:hypothetical protein
VEVIIRIDGRNLADCADLKSLDDMGAFPPGALRARPALMADHTVHELQVNGDAARYLLELLALGISGEPRLAEWQATKAGQVELNLDPPAPPQPRRPRGHKADCICLQCEDGREAAGAFRGGM